MVIGMDVGTTVTSAIASIGGGTATKRTGYSHVVYNILTGIMAFFLLDGYSLLVERLWPGALQTEAQASLVGFHTLFNTIGVIAVLPVAGAFARLMEHLVPERQALIGRLDPKLIADTGSALAAATRTARELSAATLTHTALVLRSPSRARPADEDLADAIGTLERYIGQIHSQPESGAVHSRHVAVMHATDHLQRLRARLSQTERLHAAARDSALSEAGAKLAQLLEAEAEALLEDRRPAIEELDRQRADLRQLRHDFRARTLQEAASHRLGAEQALLRVDAARWLHRVAYHAWRMAVHLQPDTPRQPAGAPLAAEQALPED